MSFINRQSRARCAFLKGKNIVWLTFILLIQLMTVADVKSQCVMSCRSKVNLSLAELGWSKVDPQAVLLNSSGCSNFIVEIRDSLNQNLGDTANCSMIGKKLTVSVIDTSPNGNHCWGYLVVEDKVPPKLTCDTVFINCNDNAAPTSIGYIAATDNCTPILNKDLSYYDVFTDLPCFSTSGILYVTAKIDRYWSVKDNSGNTASCVQTIYYKRLTPEDVIFPKSLDDINKPALECDQDPTDFNITGFPTINGKKIENAGLCELAVAYSDQKVQLCGTRSYKILREWKIIDWCASTQKIVTQLIKVKDSKPPVITPPANITVSTTGNNCTAGVSLPMASATDNCSSLSIEATSSFGSGLGPFVMPVGTHVITYSATDACGNRSTATMKVTVVDNVPPTAVCDEDTDVALNFDGTAIVYASTFNDGSHDNCALDRFLAKRDTLPYDTIVRFTCADLKGPVQVFMKVLDKAGLSNTCMVWVKVQDFLPPLITCPPTKHLVCKDDVFDFKVVEKATATDNCTIKSVTYRDEAQLTCGVGRIVRYWTATDQSSNSAICAQQIFLRDTTPITIVFPKDTILYGCNIAADTSVTGRPIISGNDCELVALTYVDQIFPIAPPACFKVIRNWQVVNWCEFVPNTNNNGMWIHQQVIKVLDTIAPVMTCPAATTVGINNQDCLGSVNLTNATATDCSQYVTITNNSPYATARGASLNGTYPQGVYTVTFTAEDGCGNVSNCVTELTVKDTKPPTPVCLNGISISLMPTGMVPITAAIVEKTGASWDNCTPYPQLKIEATPTQFTCSDLGYQYVKMTVTDAAGNTSYCIASVFVQDNMGVCNQDTVTANLSGTIQTEDGRKSKEVEVYLTGGMNNNTMTGDDGHYMFANVLKRYSYNVNPYNTKNPSNGVSTADLVLIRKHILGIENLNTPYKVIAADANQDRKVSTADMVELRKLILQVIDTLPKRASWRFIPARYIFQIPENPLLESFPEVLDNQQIIAGNYTDGNFVAIKIGDVNNNADVTRSAERMSREITLDLTLSQPTIQPENVVSVAFVPTRELEVAGCQFLLRFDPGMLKYKGIQEGAFLGISEDNLGLSRLNEGLIAISWIGKFDTNKEWFTLNFEKIKPTDIQPAFSIVSGTTLSAEAYDENLNAYNINLRVNDIIEATATKNHLYQNQPNPFSESTKVGFYLEEGTELVLIITDMAGRNVKTLTGIYEKGYHVMTVQASDLPSGGVYHYTLKTADGAILTRKMILLMQ